MIGLASITSTIGPEGKEWSRFWMASTLSPFKNTSRTGFSVLPSKTIYRRNSESLERPNSSSNPLSVAPSSRRITCSFFLTRPRTGPKKRTLISITAKFFSVFFPQPGDFHPQAGVDCPADKIHVLVIQGEQGIEVNALSLPILGGSPCPSSRRTPDRRDLRVNGTGEFDAAPCLLSRVRLDLHPITVLQPLALGGTAMQRDLIVTQAGADFVEKRVATGVVAGGGGRH